MALLYAFHRVWRELTKSVCEVDLYLIDFKQLILYKAKNPQPQPQTHTSVNPEKKRLLETLLAKNVIWIEDTVNEETFEYVGMSIATLMGRGSPPIKLYLTSDGGLVHEGLYIFDLLMTYPGQIEGIVAGYARSMAVVILQACTKRLTFEHSHIMIHHVSTQKVTLDIMRSDKRRRERLGNMEKDQADIYRILSRRTGKSVREISRVCAQNKDMTATEAKTFGLIDDIVPHRSIE
ncbi:MAG: hypothetical protein RLZZ67_472 [Candidatus Parcubacteria bacterium]|jgi:ATP-dependent Clp protease protease subunit